jgi:transcriptional regulator GlxA family with amidase domain
VPEPIRIALLGYHGVQTLDLVGPLDAFSSATQARPGAYRTLVTSIDGAPFRSEAGLKVVPDCALADAGPIDTLIVPGGEGVRRPGIGDALAAALRRHAAAPRRVVSVCTGIYAVAAAGLLDDRRATTHWRFAGDVAARFPAVRVEPDAIFIKDGRVYTSAGISAAIDLSLALIEEDFGPALALGVARDLVVYLKRAGGQRQYSEPLRFQARVTDRFADLAAWMLAHLHEKLSIETLAARACLSPRQFSREFRRVFGHTPAEQLEVLRLDAARNHLTTSEASVDRIAVAVGFRSSDAFRRAFDRRFGLSPTDYRRRFAARAPLERGDPDANTSRTVVALPGPAERSGG